MAHNRARNDIAADSIQISNHLAWSHFQGKASVI